MKNKLTHEDYEIFAQECLGHLPDSLRRRKVCLRCLLRALPRDHERRIEAAKILTHLQAAERIQQEFIFTRLLPANHN